MDKIILKDLGFYGYHGVFEEEKKLGQKFFIDIKLYGDFREAGKNDDLSKSVHYGEVYELVKTIVEDRSYDLLEALAENICKEVLESFDLVEKIKLRVKKPEAPVAGVFDYCGVEIKRGREDYE